LGEHPSNNQGCQPMNKRIILAAALSTFFATPAFAVTCPDLIIDVNSKLASSGDSMNDEVEGEIVALRNAGQDLLATGDDAACQEKLEEALSLFTQ